MTTEDATTIARKDQSNEIRIGPITRARAKLLEQQVNLLLNESGTLIDENFILPKSMHLCMIRFVGETSMARGGEGLQEKPNMMIAQGCAREEREEGAREDHQDEGKKICHERSVRPDPPGLSGQIHPDCPAWSRGKLAWTFSMLVRTLHRRHPKTSKFPARPDCPAHFTRSVRPDRTVLPTSTGVSAHRPNLVRVGLYQFESFAFSFGFWSLQPPL